ncbi:MAG: amino acid adenylation domain-containing protein [Syntrophomonadaceae bacterium]|nr:amino acid adenylation domain-containing protein [Syntrophomonadaceae bacterium]
MGVLYPLTHPQKRIWYVEKTFPGTGVSNIAGTVRIRENVNFTALEKAINHIVKINEAMRTRIVEKSNGPMQYYIPYQPFKVDFLDFTGKPVDELYRWDTRLSRLPLRLIESELYYFAMFKLSNSEGGFYFKFHHIITDAWSIVNLYNQIMTAYHSFCEGSEPDQTPTPSYQEYIVREESYMNSEKFKRDRQFWIDQFTPVPDLVTLQTRKSYKKSIAARRKAFLLTVEEARHIREFCSSNGISIFLFFLTMLTIYINRITGSRDVVLGTTVLNRTNNREKSITGMFISTVPLRFHVDSSSRYLDYAKAANSKWVSILRHQQYPYDLLQKDIRKNHSEVENLFEVTISYQNAKLAKEMQLHNSSSRWHFSGYQNEPLVIHINDRDDEGTLILNYDYRISCFADREIDFIHTHLKSLIADAIENPEKPIYDLNIMSSEERGRILAFNLTADEHDRSATFIDLLERQVDRTPGAEAVVFHNHSLTFSEMDAAANRVAHCLRQAGIQRDEIVAVMLPRSIELLTSILGVVKSGGAFLPIDPTLPEERVRYMLENSNSRLVITTHALASRFSVNPSKVVSPHSRRVHESPPWRPPPVNTPEDLLYVIYTSGSTGLPKGVMIKHSGICALIHALRKIMFFKPGEAVLSVGTVSFDIFILEVFPSLVNGMRVVITNEYEQRIPARQKELIKKHKIAKLLVTPAQMQLMLDDPDGHECFSCLKEVMVGGDVFPETLLQQMKKVMNAEILNAYGPTETSIAVAFKNLTNTNEINIGRPIANSKVYILDQYMNLVPIGVPGEIYIGGEGLGRGYLNNPELTKQRFVPNPFAPGERLYKTGDLGRWYPRGEIAFLGRMDSQVKIRGLRIELGEIENTLRRLPAIADAVVLDVADQSKKSLCAYVVPETGSELDFHYLRNQLSKSLPTYMVPSFYMVIDSIPLNSSGKVDRRSLPKPDRSHLFRRSVDSPQTEVEFKLVSIWEEVLEVSDISVSEDFFDLGGDSLDVVNLITAIHTQFGVEFAFSDIYELRTVRQQALRILELRDLHDLSRYRNIIPLRRGTQEKSLFLVHAGNGEAVNYYHLCRRLPDSRHFYGIRYLRSGNAPCNLAIPELAAFYLEQVREIQSQNPYDLVGWCIGGTIAFAMAQQLEESGQEVRSLTLINSICPRPWEDIECFSLDTEYALLNSFLPASEMELLRNATSMEELWNEVINLALSGRVSEQNLRAAIPDEVAAAIPNFETAEAAAILRYLNVIRTIHNARALYFPTGKLKTRVHFIEVTANDVITDKEGNLAGWQRYCTQPIHRISTEGDHFSIFREPHVEGLARSLEHLQD